MMWPLSVEKGEEGQKGDTARSQSRAFRAGFQFLKKYDKTPLERTTLSERLMACSWIKLTQ